MKQPQTFLDSVCRQLFHIQLIFLVALSFVLFSVAALWYLDPNDPAFIISLFNLAGLSIIVVIFGSLTWLCNNQRPSG